MSTIDGKGVRISLPAVLDICDRMSEILRDMNEEVGQIYELREKANKYWRGTASNTFFQEYDKYNKELQNGHIKEMYKRLVDLAKLIDENKTLSAQLSEKEFENISTIDQAIAQQKVIHGVEANDIAATNTSTITSDISANNTISSVTSEVEAPSVNTELNNSVSMDTKIESNFVDSADLKEPAPENINTIINETNSSNTINNTSSTQTTSSNDNNSLASSVGASVLGDIYKDGV